MVKRLFDFGDGESVERMPFKRSVSTLWGIGTGMWNKVYVGPKSEQNEMVDILESFHSGRSGFIDISIQEVAADDLKIIDIGENDYWL